MSGMDVFGDIEPTGNQIASGLVLSKEVRGDDDIDTALLRKMAVDAELYIGSFPWCDAVLESYFGGGIGGIFAVFFFRVRPKRSALDPWIWIVLGDVPPAYLPLSDCKTPGEAFRRYFFGMSKWVESARNGQSGSPDQGIPPVDLPATPEWAEKINRKLYGLTLTVKHLFEEPGETNENRLQLPDIQ
jgi:hypothetical protein